MNLSEGEREEILKHVAEVLAETDVQRKNLIPMLQNVQKRIGYLPEQAMGKVAEALAVPAVDVYGVATFYNQFRFTPPGDNQIKVCMGTACYIVGGQIAMDSFARRLDIAEGETTPDRKYSLERVTCVGCCTMAPVVLVNDQIEGSVTPTRVDGILLNIETNGKCRDREKEQAKEGDRHGCYSDGI